MWIGRKIWIVETAIFPAKYPHISNSPANKGINLSIMNLNDFLLGVILFGVFYTGNSGL